MERSYFWPTHSTKPSHLSLGEDLQYSSSATTSFIQMIAIYKNL